MVRASGNRAATSSARRSTPGPTGVRLSGVAAVRAGLGPRLEVAAVVAHQHAAEAVLDQPGRAVGALEAVAAGPAQRQRRIAAPVEEQQRLLPRASVSPIAATSGGARKRPRSGWSRAKVDRA